MKYIYCIISIIFYSLVSVQAFAATNAPTINCYGLPGCNDEKWLPSDPNVKENSFTEAIAETIAFLMPYVAVLAVLAIMISGVMYLLSAGDEDKVNRAKKWIIWSLVWVLLSLSSWYIVATLWKLSFKSNNSNNPANISPN